MKKLTKLLWVAVVPLVLVTVWYISTFTVSVTRVELESDKIKTPVNIVQITDLHGAVFGADNRHLINKIKEQSPHIIIATGDMYTAGDEAGRTRAEALLTELTKLCPVYYVNGEHDNSDSFHDALIAGGVRVLDYKTENLDIDGNPITLYGIDNVYYSPTFDLYNEFTPDRERFNLLAAHICNPSAFADFAADLTLCGDTHGGQIRLPILGALYDESHDLWLPERYKGVYMKGLYPLGEGQLFVSSGLGNRPYPIRLFNRPEVALIVLK